MAERVGELSPISFGMFGFVVTTLAVGMIARTWWNRRQPRTTFSGRMVYEQVPEVP